MMGASSSLQKAFVAALRADPAVAALVGARVYDVAPEGVTYPFVTLGPTSFTPERQDGFERRAEVVQIDAWSDDQRRTAPIKDLCDAIVAAIDNADLPLDAPLAIARVELRLARVFDDPDGITKHGVLQFECEITGTAW